MYNFKKQTTIAATLLFLVSITVLLSCKKKDDPTPVAKPEITSISPSSAKVGATITITGENFKAGTEGVAVTIEGIAATVSSATLTSIVCVVPEVAVGPADVIVSINTLASVAFNSFEVLDKSAPNPLVPEITSISPVTALPGASVTITGVNLKEGLTGVSVTFAGTAAKLSSATATSIVCLVPQIAAGQADVVVTVDGQSSLVFKSFTVEKGVQLTSFAPERGRFDTIITLTGEKFGTDSTLVKVTVNGKKQQITAITDTQLKIKLAKKTWSGAVVVEKDGVISTATKELEYFDSYRSEVVIVDRRGDDVIVGDDGKIYVSYVENIISDGIFVFDEQGNSIDTLMKGYYSSGLYMGNNNKLYVSSGWPLILTYDFSNGSIDTISNLKEMSYLESSYIVGDNNNTLYSVSGYDKKICKTTISVKNSTKTIRTDAEIIKGVALYNNRIYYTTRTKIVSMNTDGSDVTELISNGYFQGDISIDSKGNLYISTANSTISVFKNNKFELVKKISNDEILGLHITKDDVIFTCGGQTDDVYKIYIE